MFLLHQSTHRMVIRYHPKIGHLYVPNLNARIPHEAGGYYVQLTLWDFAQIASFVTTTMAVHAFFSLETLIRLGTDVQVLEG